MTSRLAVSGGASLQDAIPIANEAVKQDNLGNRPSAINLYSKAAELLLQELKGNSHPQQFQAQLRSRIESYISRAEKLKGELPAQLQDATTTKALAQRPSTAAAQTSTTTRREESSIKRRSSLPNRAKPASSSSAKTKDADLKHRILDDVLDKSPGISWDDIAGLEQAKQTMKESVILPSLRPDIFTGLRAPPRGVLLYGPPGTGKTMLAKAVATSTDATFFSISAASVTSRWMGEGEKLVRAMFELARELQPSVIFIDEIDSILSARDSGEHESSRRIKTEFLVQFDGVASTAEERILVLGATNLPQELDTAVLRRMTKRIYIPLPDMAARFALLQHLLSGHVSEGDLRWIAKRSEGYSGSDLTALCKEAALAPVRDLGARIASVDVKELRSLNKQDFADAMNKVRPSVLPSALAAYEDWTAKLGSE